MKNTEHWSTSKFVQNKRGRWISSKNSREVIIPSRLMVDLIAQWYEHNIPLHVQGKLLDLGCGKAPLFGMYHSYATEIVCADWGNSIHGDSYVDTFCDLNKPLPFADNTFDTIIISDVLEHIVEPESLCGEMYRILQPSGKILMNVPFYHPIHEEPHDYFRYTEFALCKFADKYKFEVLELSSSNGFLLIATDIICFGTHKIPVIGKFLTIMLQKIAKTLLMKGKNKNNKHFPLQYFLVLQK